MNLSIIMYFLLSVIFITACFNMEYCLNIVIMLFFAIPFSWSFTEYFRLYTSILGVKVSMHDLLFILLVLISIINTFINRRLVTSSNPIFMACILFIIIVLIYACVGFTNNRASNVITDLRNMMYYFVIFIFYSFNFKINNVEKIIQSLIFGAIIFSLIDIVLFAFKDTIFLNLLIKMGWENQSRIGFTNSILIVLLLPICLNKHVFNSLRYKKVSLIMLSITLILGQSITLIVIATFILISLIIIYKNDFYNDVKRKRYIGIFLTIILFNFLTIVFLIYKDSIILHYGKPVSDLISKITSSIYNLYDLPSIRSRIVTFDYAFDEFKENIWGYGLGKTFTTFMQNGTVADYNHMFVDNLFYTLINKMGINGFIYYCFFITIIVINLSRNFKKVDDMYKSLLEGFTIAFLFLLLLNFTTAQMIMSPMVITTFQIMICFSVIITKDKCKVIEYKSNNFES